MACQSGSQGLVAFHNFFHIPLGVSRNLVRTRPLLIVLEHASGSWLASAQDLYRPGGPGRAPCLAAAEQPRSNCMVALSPCGAPAVTNSFGACTWILARQCRGFGKSKYSPTARCKSKVGVDQA